MGWDLLGAILWWVPREVRGRVMRVRGTRVEVERSRGSIGLRCDQGGCGCEIQSSDRMWDC